MGVGALVRRKRGAPAGAIDDGGEAFLGVVDHEEVIDQLLLLFNQAHPVSLRGRGAACKDRAICLNPSMVNPFVLGWFWRGLKGHSVTFAALFASVLLGASIAGGLKRLLGALGVHWLYVIIIPIVLFGWLSKREAGWLPDQGRRRLIARSILFGSILLAVAIGWLKPSPPAEPFSEGGPAPSVRH
jgi:hypothetical protein